METQTQMVRGQTTMKALLYLGAAVAAGAALAIGFYLILGVLW